MGGISNAEYLFSFVPCLWCVPEDVAGEASLKKMGKERWIVMVLMCLAGCITGTDASSDPPVVIGAVEDVLLLPLGISAPARIDTGATTTSIDACNLKISDGYASFTLPESCGSQALRLPIVGWRHIRTAAKRQKRPVVEIELCLGTKKIKARANLNDRSSMSYPILIGRNVLAQGFLVDASRTRIQPPLCSDLRE
jgi:hypothetical protein